MNRVQKPLEDTNLKLDDVVSDSMGKASRMILQEIVDGETDPGRLAALAVQRSYIPPFQSHQIETGNKHHDFKDRDQSSYSIW